MEENTVALEYVTNASNQTAVAYEVGLISGGYAGALGEGWNAERMNVTAVTAEGEPVRTFHIDSSWARQLNTEEISSTEYFNMVYETAETASGGNETTATATAEASA